MAKSLDDYKTEQKSLQRKISSRKEKNKKLSGEIERLKDAYEKLGKIKRKNTENADLVRDKTKLNKVAKNVAWRGEYKDRFDYSMKYCATPAAKDFFDSIDDMQDEIGKALDRKQAEYDYGIGILNGLNKAWEAVTGTIRNWVN